MPIELQQVNATADLIIKYGFLGVGVVLAMVIAPIVYGLWKSKFAAAASFSFGLAFIVVYGALDIVQRHFPLLISSDRVLLGVVLNVPNGFHVQVASDLRKHGAAYLKREIDVENGELNNFPFLIFNSRSPSCLSIAINNNDPASEMGSSAFHVAPISAQDLKSSTLVIQAVRSAKSFQLRVWREKDEKRVGAAQSYDPLSNGDAGCTFGQTANIFDWILSPAFAQSGGASLQDLSIRLRSDDAFTRRNARIELSKQGTQTIELAKQFLDSNDYRLQLGALVALSILPELELKKMPVELFEKVNRYTASKDETTRDTAIRIQQRASTR